MTNSICWACEEERLHGGQPCVGGYGTHTCETDQRDINDRRTSTARFVTDECQDPFTLVELIDANADAPISDDDLDMIENLRIGASVTLYGGASGNTVFTRVE